MKDKRDQSEAKFIETRARLMKLSEERVKMLTNEIAVNYTIAGLLCDTLDFVFSHLESNYGKLGLQLRQNNKLKAKRVKELTKEMRKDTFDLLWTQSADDDEQRRESIREGLVATSEWFTYMCYLLLSRVPISRDEGNDIRMKLLSTITNFKPFEDIDFDELRKKLL